jgi:hypothetical protein
MSEPYTLWRFDAPFTKQGVPVMGTCGASVGAVVVMRTETLKRMIDEHPTLKVAEFRIGEYDDA